MRHKRTLVLQVGRDGNPTSPPRSRDVIPKRGLPPSINVYVCNLDGAACAWSMPCVAVHVTIGSYAQLLAHGNGIWRQRLVRSKCHHCTAILWRGMYSSFLHDLSRDLSTHP